MLSRIKFLCLLVLAAVIMVGCAQQSAELGTAKNPIKMAMVPSLDTNKLILSGNKLAELLEKETGLKYDISVPASYTAVITAMGSGNVDVGWLPPVPYVIAHDKYGVEVALVTVRNKSTKYWSFIIARTDTGINNLADLKGKRFAFGDPVSTSGAIYPKHLIRSSGFDPKNYFTIAIYEAPHDRVLMAVYNKQVDGGAIYGGVGTDAREKVVNSLPDVLEKTHVIAKSVEIPNDTVSVRKGISPEVVKKITDGLIKVAASDEGRITIMSLYGIDGFERTTDSDYNSVREVTRSEKIEIEQLDKKY